MTIGISIRQAEPRDLDWISDHYRALDFLPSDISESPIAVAESGGERIGLGRLSAVETLADGAIASYELGGLWVAHAFRGKNTAEELIMFLLARAKGKKIYVIPFKGPLADFLAGLHFRVINMADPGLPAKLVEKIRFCLGQYAEEICLMEYHTEAK